MKSNEINPKKRGRPRKVEGQDGSGSQPFYKKVINCDKTEGQELLNEQSGLEFDRANGKPIERLELEIIELKDRYTDSNKIRAKLEEKVRNTAPTIKSSLVHGEGSDKRVPFAKWELRDQIIVVSGLIFALALILAGMATIRTTILASGIPVFIDQPWLANFFVLLLPAGSFAIKFYRDTLENDFTRKIYTNSIFGVSLLSLLSWIVLFSLNFHGVSAELNLDSFDGSGNLGTWFTGCQILGEMTVSGSLFILISDTVSKYSPNVYVENPELIRARKVLHDHIKEHEVLRDQFAEKLGSLKELRSGRQAYKNEQLARFLSERGRWDASDDSAPGAAPIPVK